MGCGVNRDGGDKRVACETGCVAGRRLRGPIVCWANGTLVLDLLSLRQWAKRNGL